MSAIVPQTWKYIGIAAICLASLAQPVRAGLFTDTAAGPQTMVLDDLALQHQRMVLAGSQAPLAHEVLRDSLNRLNENLNALAKGGKIGRCKVPDASQSLGAGLLDLRKKLNASRVAAKTLIDTTKQVEAVFKATREVEQHVSPLQELTEQFIELKIKSDGKPREIASGYQLHSLLHRLASNALRFANAESVSPETAFMLGRDANTIDNITRGLIDGSEVLRLPGSKGADRAKAIELAAAFNRIRTPVGEALKNLQPYIAAKQSQMLLLEDRESILLAIQNLRNQLPEGETCSVSGK